MQAALGEQASASTRGVSSIRADFPMFEVKDDCPGLHYLDNAATTQKPALVIDTITDCYRRHNAPVHRGLYPQAEAASALYESARESIAAFIGAAHSQQLVFTRSTTESINMVARGWVRQRLLPGDEIWVSQLEHHANYLPWQAICRESGARLRIMSAYPDGSLNLAACADEIFSGRCKLIAITQVSNVLGIVHPLKDLCRQAKQHGIPVLVDAAQAIGHMPVDVVDLDCDFLAFSAHKMFGPTGIGALYAKAEHLETMEPLLLGGGMVDVIGESNSEWMPYPQRFEAGTPNLADALGFAAAVDYIRGIGVEVLHERVLQLAQTLHLALAGIDGVRLFGPADPQPQTGIVSFQLDDVHPHDLGQILGEHNVAIRAGHHCCQPLMAFLGVAATARVSLAAYNTEADIDALVAAIGEAKQIFA